MWCCLSGCCRERERENHLGKIDHSISCVCVCVWKHRLSSSKAKVNPEYPSHFSVPFHKEGAGEARGRVKWEMGADTHPDTGNPSAVKHHRSRHHASKMQGSSRRQELCWSGCGAPAGWSSRLSLRWNTANSKTRHHVHILMSSPAFLRCLACQSTIITSFSVCCIKASMYCLL